MTITKEFAIELATKCGVDWGVTAAIECGVSPEDALEDYDVVIFDGTEEEQIKRILEKLAHRKIKHYG